jgi:hypothetical protein
MVENKTLDLISNITKPKVSWTLYKTGRMQDPNKESIQKKNVQQETTSRQLRCFR